MGTNGDTNGIGLPWAGGVALLEVSQSMGALATAVRELANSVVPVLLLGEVGVGKRTTAQRIHALSGRSGEPFVAIDSRQIRGDNFNTVRTGLTRSGTLYLSEVTDLNRACQGKLLELLPGGGARGEQAVSGARLICGSIRDLDAAVRSGGFREDLYYRISGVCLRLPPLRQRREDITGLVQMFLRKYADEFHCPVPVLTETTERLFREYGWPGNMREIEDAARAIVAMGGEALAMSGLRSVLAGEGSAAPAERISLKQASRAASREAERELILKALTRTRWNRKRAAQDLQISYKALLYKLKQIGLQEQGAI